MAPRQLGTLTPQQALFVEHYIATKLNGAEAAKLAGYSARSAASMASDLLTRPKVRAAVEDRLRPALMAAKADADAVLAELSSISSANILDFLQYDADGVALFDSKELTRAQGGLISEVSSTKGQFGTNVKIKLHDKLAALQMLGKYMKLFTDNLNLSGNVDVRTIGPPPPTDEEEDAAMARTNPDLSKTEEGTETP